MNEFNNWAKVNPKVSTNGEEELWEVAILTFYLNQEDQLREMLNSIAGQDGNNRNYYLPKSNRKIKITLCTVDRFQWHEADIVFLSFVKHNSVGFLNSPNRLNVALTRARYQLIIVGNRTYFKNEKHCKSVLLNNVARSNYYGDSIAWRKND